MQETLEIKRKRLIFRSWHRGTREIDLLLGRFADANVPGMDEKMASLYDAFLSNSDPDIYNWITLAEPIPPSEESALTVMMLDYFSGAKRA